MIYLMFIFLKIGFLGFGGGYMMLSLILNDATTLGITLQQFSDLNALDLLAPGPIAVNSATYVGYVTHGFLGAVVATLAVCFSGVFFSSLLLRYETTLLNYSVINQFLKLIKIAAVAMITSVAFSLMQSAVFEETYSFVSIASIILTAICRFKYQLHPLLVLLFASGMGVLCYLIA